MPQHLPGGVLAAEEDPFRIDGHGLVVVFFGRIVDPRHVQMSALDRDACVVDHDV